MKIKAIGQLVKTNPIQTQSNPILSAVGGFRKAKMNVNLTLTKDYRKYDVFAAQKTNPNKPNFRQEIPK